MEAAETRRRGALLAALLALACALALALAPALARAAWADDEETTAHSLPESTTSSYTTSGGTAYSGVYVLGSSGATATYEDGTLKSGTYVLDGDVAVTGTFTVSGSKNCAVTIDLNDHAISYAGSSTTEPTILAPQSDVSPYYGCTLTICDGSSDGGGTITGSNSSGGVINCVSESENGTTDEEPRVYLNLQGGTIGGNESGYGIHLSCYCTFTMTGGAVSGNGKTGVYNYSAPAVLEISSGTISNNGDTGSSKGGGVYVYNSSTLTLSGGSISNTAIGSQGQYSWSGGYAGGAYCYMSSFTMTGGSITDNTAATTCAGGLYLSYCSATVSNGSISENTATTYAGGVYVGYKATLTMSGGSISDNTAGTYGGGLVATGSSASATIEGVTISGNTAGTMGGGLYVEASGSAISVTLDSASVTGNEAGTYGGGAYVAGYTYTNSKGTTTTYGAALTVSSGTLANNAAATAGADVYSAGTYGETLSFDGVNSSVTFGDGLGQTIDGWYDDSAGSRYEDTSEKTSYSSFTSGTSYALIAAYGNAHAYGEPTWTWTLADGGYEATATFTCSVREGDDAHSQEVTATVTAAEDGDSYSYEAEAAFCGDLFTDTLTLGSITFLGGGLRMAVESESADDYAESASSAALRLGFTYSPPVTVASGDGGGLTATADAENLVFYWSVATDSSKVASWYTSYSATGTVKRLYDEDSLTSESESATYLSNLVTTDIEAANYGTTVYARMWAVYSTDEGTVILVSDETSGVVERSVSQVCSAIQASCTAGTGASAAENAYATALLSALSSATSTDSD